MLDNVWVIKYSNFQIERYLTIPELQSMLIDLNVVSCQIAHLI